MEAIVSGLSWLHTVPDEGPAQGGAYGPYTQSERLKIYHICCEALLESGHAYRCFCTAERLDQVRPIQAKQKVTPMYDRRCRDLTPEQIQANLDAGLPYVVRLKVPQDREITITDAVRGDITFHSSTGPIVDIKLLQFINNHYINCVDSMARTAMLQDYLSFLSATGQTAMTSVVADVPGVEIEHKVVQQMLDEVLKDPDYTAHILSLKPGRYERLADMVPHNLYFYDATFVPARVADFLKNASADRVAEILEGFSRKLDARPAAVGEILEEMIHDMGLNKKELFMTLRLAVTGQEKSPPLGEIAPILGEFRMKERLAAALACVRAA